MPYAILQRDLAPPPAEKLRRAFRLVPFLQDIDATTMARDAFGILLGGLAFEDATALQRALQADGLHVEVVDEQRLAPLPQPKRLKRALCQATGLTAFDPLGREIGVAWPHVILVAAGSVRLSRFKRIERDYVVKRGVPGGRGSMPIVLTESSHREERGFELLVEIYVDIAPGRFRASISSLQYEHPDQGLRSNPAQTYNHFVRDLIAHAPEAIRNRGADAVRGEPPAVFAYPTRHAFEEETVWLLWRRLLS